MKYFLFKKTFNEITFCINFRKQPKKEETIYGFLSKPSRLMALAQKSGAMSNKIQNRKITYKSGDTEINSENGGSAPIVMMFIHLILRWIFLLLVLFIAVKLPVLITLLMKIII